MTSRRDRLALATAAGSAIAFLALAAAFWIGSHSNVAHLHAPSWTRLGEAAGWHVLPFLMLVVVLALALTGRWRAARLVLVSVAGAGVLQYIARIVLQAVGANAGGGRLSDFPSGHTTVAAALAGALAVVVWLETGRRSIRVLAVVLAAAAVVLIGWARVAIGAHSPLDVLGGVALGVCWLSVCVLVVPPDREVVVTRRQVLWLALAGGSGGFVFLAALYSRTPLSVADADAASWVARHLPDWADSVGKVASDVGSWSAWAVAVGVPLALLALRRLRDAVWAAVTLAGIHVLTAVLKDAFDRPRPHAGSAIPLPGSPSFPSGHASGAVVTFGVLAALAAERWPRGAPVWWTLAALLALAIGTSRVVLDVHYVTDVLAGWCLGVAWLAAALLVRDRLAASGADRRVGERR